MKGSCLCGAIEVTAPDQDDIGLCHCGMCRRWSGGPFFALHLGTHVEFGGGKPSTYRSSEWAERGFCPTCGTHLFYRLLSSNEYILSAGLFHERPFHLGSQIFIDEKPDWYELANQTPKLTGAQAFAQFAGEDA
ncbi:GFA family protein [Lysobacter pythonis]|uniref:GFA family protein n=1 Tax=Solilutibacter pythonis TaxID=2483112 RepID=A0A3M2I0R0_9GAMM|nr:GFA family protein [Lysobacter pythonis]RMH93500.1 GFA family protein [Lysobacter pythonis]